MSAYILSSLQVFLCVLSIHSWSYILILVVYKHIRYIKVGFMMCLLSKNCMMYLSVIICHLDRHIFNFICMNVKKKKVNLPLSVYCFSIKVLRFCLRTMIITYIYIYILLHTVKTRLYAREVIRYAQLLIYYFNFHIIYVMYFDIILLKKDDRATFKQQL